MVEGVITILTVMKRKMVIYYFSEVETLTYSSTEKSLVGCPDVWNDVDNDSTTPIHYSISSDDSPMPVSITCLRILPYYYLCSGFVQTLESPEIKS